MRRLGAALGNQVNDHYLPAKRIAHAAAELEGDARRSYVEREAGNDPDLANEVWWMISAIEATGTVGMPRLVEPAVDLSGSAAQATAPRNYRVLRRIGEGGMGVVYLAERSDGDFIQQVALKFLNTAAEDSPVLLERFAQERQLLARMEHPGIARLLDGGVLHDGRPFLAMEYIEGERIDRWCARRDLPLHDRLVLFLKVCAAVEYAHRHLVIHRDIKPANILVTRDGEPKLLDFGIARVVGENGDVAQTETLLHALTLAYASPEQIDKQPLTTAADVYSLGVVFYELVSGRRPFHQLTTPHQLSSAIMHGDVPPPSRHAMPGGAGRPKTWLRRSRTLPADIDAIALKAMRREASKRYATVTELSDDIERFLAMRAVRAMRGRVSYRFNRYVWRNRWLLGATTVAFLAVLAGLFGSLYALQQTRVQQRLAELRQHEMERTVAFQQSMLESVDINAMGRALVDAQGRRMQAALDADTAAAKVPAKLAGAAKDLMTYAIAHVSAPDIARDALDVQVVSHALDDLDKTVGDDPLLAADLRQSLARVLITIGSYDHAIAALKKVILTRTVMLPGNDTRLLSARADLGHALTLRGKLAEAADVFDSASLDAARLPIEDPTRIAVEAGRARVIAERGHLQEARTLEEALYAQLRAKLPENDRNVMRVRRDLVSTLIDLGLRDKAIAHMEPLAALYRSTLGLENPETLDALSTLAELLNFQNEYERSLALARELVSIRTRLQGAEHPATLRDLNSEAMNMVRLARDEPARKEATAAIRHVVDERSRVLGATNPQTLDSMTHLVRILSKDKKLAQAIEVEKRILDTQVAVRGPDHPDTLFARGALASLLKAAKRYPEALAMAQSVLEAQRRVLGHDHPIAFATVDLIGRIQYDSGHLQEARAAYQEALEGRERLFGPTDDHTGESAVTLYDTVAALHDKPAMLALRKKYLEPMAAQDPDKINAAAQGNRKDAIELLHADGRTDPVKLH
jgi:serine/threonine-protein kinase